MKEACGVAQTSNQVQLVKLLIAIQIFQGRSTNDSDELLSGFTQEKAFDGSRTVRLGSRSKYS